MRVLATEKRTERKPWWHLLLQENRVEPDCKQLFKNSNYETWLELPEFQLLLWRSHLLELAVLWLTCLCSKVSVFSCCVWFWDGCQHVLFVHWLTSLCTVVQRQIRKRWCAFVHPPSAPTKHNNSFHCCCVYLDCLEGAVLSTAGLRLLPLEGSRISSWADSTKMTDQMFRFIVVHVLLSCAQSY